MNCDLIDKFIERVDSVITDLTSEQDRYHEMARVLYDSAKQKYYVLRLDCPGEEYHEITLGGINDLMKRLRWYGREISMKEVLELSDHLERYQRDHWNEKHKQ